MAYVQQVYLGGSISPSGEVPHCAAVIYNHRPPVIVGRPGDVASPRRIVFRQDFSGINRAREIPRVAVDAVDPARRIVDQHRPSRDGDAAARDVLYLDEVGIAGVDLRDNDIGGPEDL